MKPISDDPAAPFGYDDDGEAKAPYGLKRDGLPRRSNRGSRPGSFGNGGAPAAPTSSATPRKGSTARQKRDTLVSLVGAFVTPALVGASVTPLVQRLLGPGQAMALSGDAVILNHYAAPFFDCLVAVAEEKPGLLAWMDGMEDKAPYLALLSFGIQIGKAIGANHLNPDPRLGNAGIALMAMTAQQMAADIEAQAAAMGINVPGFSDQDNDDQGEPAGEQAA